MAVVNELDLNDITLAAVHVLNEALKCDSAAFGELCTKSVDGTGFKDHPDILTCVIPGSLRSLRLLGVVNGILDRLGCLGIVAEYREDVKHITPNSRPIHFRQVVSQDEYRDISHRYFS